MSAQAAVESHVMAVVGDLVSELRTGAATAAPTLDSSLERELGIGSLERVELMLRLERATGIRLEDRVMVAADTPRDLVRAFLSTTATAAAEPPPAVRPAVGGAAPAPSSARTLVDVLRWHADTHGDRVHIFLRDEEGGRTAISYAALYDRASRAAGLLRERGIARHDTVAIMLRTEQAFFWTFFGTLLAGAIPVPIYPPFRADRIEEYVGRQAGILRSANVRLLVTFAEAERIAALVRAQVPGLSGVITPDRLSPPEPVSADRRETTALLPGLGPDDPALIQYTSGSTSDPKGVLLTHANLLANVRAIAARIEVRPDDVGVSWLPLYHDMGLIGAWLGTLYFGTPVAIMSPLAFLTRPARWLWALHEHRGTLSAAPNFAFDLCARKVADADLEGLDLSAVRLLLNGAEPVLPETVERFTKRFARYGLRPGALCPVYGLAESSVGLAFSPTGRPPRIDAIDRARFQQRGIASPAATAPAVRFVACGQALPGHEIRIADDTGTPLAERQVGAVQFRGPSVTPGYFRNPEATRECTTADGWMDSGDLGYLAEGDLFITGRRKDLIIKGGRNFAPQEIERAASEVGGVRPGCVAAFGIDDPGTGTERLLVVAETREAGTEAARRIERQIVEAVAAAVGVPPDVVVVAKPGAVLKTSSGKVRRRATREAYLAGRLGRRRALVMQVAALLAGNAAARANRVVARVLAAGYTAYAAVVVAVALPALVIPVLMVPAGRAAEQLVRGWCRLILVVGGCRVTVRGVEYLQDLDRAMIVGNHASYLDVIVLLGHLPGGFRFAAKRRLAKYPLLGTIIRKLKCVTIDRTDLSRRMAGADAVAATLSSGQSVFVFPEGTFVRAPGLLPFRLGAFRAAVEAGRPVVPVALRGTRAIWPDGILLTKPGRVTVTVAEPLQPSGTGWQEIVRMRDLARAAIARECGEPAGLY